MKRIFTSIIFVVTFFLMQTLLFPIGLAMGSFFPDASPEQINLWTALVNIAIHVLVVLFFIFLSTRHKDKSTIERSAIYETPQILKYIGIGVVAIILAQVIAALVHIYVFNIEWIGGNTQTIFQMVNDAPIILLIVIVLGPIIEEFVFRRAIFGELYERLPGPRVLSFIIAFVISGFFFAILHGDANHLLVYLLMSLVFSALYVITGRILVPIVVHILMNAGVVLVLFFGPDAATIQNIFSVIQRVLSVII